jgi:hypothetical protein
MSVQGIYRNILSLCLFVCAPLCIHGDCCQPSQDQNVLENTMVNQNSTQEHDLVSKSLRSKKHKKHNKLTYYLFVEDFAKSFIEIPTSNVSSASSTISSKYLAGRAAVYNEKNEVVGTCSASFLCMQNGNGIFTDIANYLSIDNGLIVTWFTPTTLINLELDSIIHSMVTECIVIASTKVGFNPFYGKTFNMVVSSDDQKIYFKLKEI